MMVSSSTSANFLALMIMASFLNRDCEAVYGVAQLIEVTHQSVTVDVVANDGSAFHSTGGNTLSPSDGVVFKMGSSSATRHIFEVFFGLNPFRRYRITVPDLKEDSGGAAGTPFVPSTVYLDFCTKPAPPADFAIGDSGATTSSIPLKWSSTGADAYDVRLDGEFIEHQMTGSTYNVTHRSNPSKVLTAGTGYVCTLAAVMYSDEDCATDLSESQTILCSTAQPADAPTCAIPDAPNGLAVDASGTTDSEIKITWQEANGIQGDIFNVFLNDLLMTTINTSDTMEHVFQHTDSAGLVKLEANTAYVCKVVSEETTDGPCYSEPKTIACMTKPEVGDDCEEPSSASVIIPKLSCLCILVITFFFD